MHAVSCLWENTCASEKEVAEMLEMHYDDVASIFKVEYKV